MPPKAEGKAKAYAFTPKAYAKAVMHSCKHTSFTVNGAFIGYQDSEKIIRFLDAVPLFHTHSLAPSAKIAFMLIDEYCKDLKGPKGEEVEVCGYYYANASAGGELGPISRALADKLLANCPYASVWALDASKLPEDQFALCGLLPTPYKDDWTQIGDSAPVSLLNPDTIAETRTLLADLRYHDLADMDDHFSDCSKDWLNPKLFSGTGLDKLPVADRPAI